MATRVPRPGTPGAQARVLSRRSRVRPKTEGNSKKPRPTIPQSHPPGRGNKQDRTTSCCAHRPTTLQNLANLADKRPDHGEFDGDMGLGRNLHACTPLQKVQGRHSSRNSALKLT